jgi:phosphomevalonate kinase
LIVFFLKIHKKDLELVHRLAQYCHSLAQGKLGSGFDVCAAVFGSQIYQRFSTTALDYLMPEGEVRTIL